MFQMLLQEDEKYMSARDLECGVDVECVWICHKGGARINKPLCGQMVTPSRRLLQKLHLCVLPLSSGSRRRPLTKTP